MFKVKILFCIALIHCTIVAIAQVCYDFEDGDIPPDFKLSQGSHWYITKQALAGTYSLADSIAAGIAATDELFSFAIPAAQYYGADTFSMLLKFEFGSNTIGNNNFQVFIGANSDFLTLNNTLLTAFVLSFVGASGNDTLRLYHKLKGNSLTINASNAIINTKIRANNNLLAIRLVRSQEGILTLSVGNDGDFNTMQHYSAVDRYDYLAGNHCGVRLTATTTNNRKYLRIDNIYAHLTQINTTTIPYGSVVFSELMPHPSSSGDFSEEYIELYNRTNHDINLSGWVLDHSTTRSVTITSGTIPANSYIMLNFNTSSENCNVAALSSTPTLTDKGKRLTLYSSQGAMIATLAYSDAWYGDADKSEGGYSLEKIDLNNLEETMENWTATTAERGGTPCSTNSVAASNPDHNLPHCTGYEIAGNVLTLHFNEALSTTNILPENFHCELGTAAAAQVPADNPMTIILTFVKLFSVNTTYTLHAQNSISDMAGNQWNYFEIPVGIGIAPQHGDVVVNEILFNPKTGGADFVELFNTSDKLLELKGSKLANRKATTGAIDKQYSITQSYVLQPQQYVVLSASPEIVCQHYRCEQPNATIAMPTMPPFPNNEGCAALLDTAGVVIDEFYYSEKMHISLLNSVKGVSLERINPNVAANYDGNWLSAAQTAGFATPTYQNSQYSDSQNGGSHDAVRLSPSVFSPDGDGRDDVLFIDYEMPSGGYLATILVYDAAGRLVRTLCKNALLGSSGRILWDGAAEQGTAASIGVYVILFEAHTLDGKTMRSKLTAVLGAKL